MHVTMKTLNLLIWLAQLGISVAAPLGGFVFLAVWLHRQQGWGVWVVIVGLALGLVCAADGLRISLRAMQRMAADRQEQPPVSFNDHE